MAWNSPSAKFKTSGAPISNAVSVKEELELKLGGVGSGGSSPGRAAGSEWSIELSVTLSEPPHSTSLPPLPRSPSPSPVRPPTPISYNLSCGTSSTSEPFLVGPAQRRRSRVHHILCSEPDPEVPRSASPRSSSNAYLIAASPTPPPPT
ncbi:hypothetical protein PQX77_019026 [Marasmius sp. AFHP31]|nr:hypothetical protein PQX77_019026 [Marasmius sp. AFHP31]